MNGGLTFKKQINYKYSPILKPHKCRDGSYGNTEIYKYKISFNNETSIKYGITCERCGMSFGGGDTILEMINSWNKEL